MRTVDRPMHQVRRVDSEDKRLWWWGYFHFTRRTYYLWRVPIWYNDLDERELPITDLIRWATGSPRSG